MSVAYIDTSVIVAIAFGEDGAEALAERLTSYSRLVSSNLLEAELRAACRREGRPVPVHLLARIGWILTHRPLTAEMETALEAGSLRGADLWHVASALYATPEPAAISFLTLDRQQARVAAARGFRGTAVEDEFGAGRGPPDGIPATDPPQKSSQ